jgi:hypothetical protein
LVTYKNYFTLLTELECRLRLLKIYIYLKARYKTHVVLKIFSNTNILSEILINSKIIPKCHKLFEARHNTPNEKIAVGTMVIILTNFAKTFQKK